MLTLTENATTIVKQISDQQPEVSGLRISEESEGAFGIALVEEAAAEDQVVEAGEGASIFLDAAAAQALDDKVLDAAVDGEGNLQFGLGEQG